MEMLKSGTITGVVSLRPISEGGGLFKQNSASTMGSVDEVHNSFSGPR